MLTFLGNQLYCLPSFIAISSLVGAQRACSTMHLLIPAPTQVDGYKRTDRLDYAAV